MYVLLHLSRVISAPAAAKQRKKRRLVCCNKQPPQSHFCWAEIVHTVRTILCSAQAVLCKIVRSLITRGE